MHVFRNCSSIFFKAQSLSPYAIHPGSVLRFFHISVGSPFCETTIMLRYCYRFPPSIWPYPSLIVHFAQPFIQIPLVCCAPLHCCSFWIWRLCFPLFSVVSESVSSSIFRPFFVSGGCSLLVPTPNLRLSLPKSKH